MEKDPKGNMTVAEAGRIGGETVKAERGREFYETIGRKGGATVKAERGRAFYEEIGRKGGETVKAERGQKVDEHGLLVLDQPAADEVAGNLIELGADEGGSHVAVPVGPGLAFEKDGADLAHLGHAAEGEAVKLFVGGMDLFEDAGRKRGRNGGE